MLLTVGLNHNTAPLAVRETVAFPADQFDTALDGFLNLPNVAEGAILSTCNRTELYAVTRTETCGFALQRWLCEQRGLNAADMARHFYIYWDRDSIRHALRVASGLDSMILGEPQILGQMKNAYRQARAAHGTGPLLTRLFEHSFAAAKQVRTHTDIGAHPVSVAYAGVNLARRIFSELAKARALFVGAGETVELSARHLARAGVRDMVFANRSIERAQALADQYHGTAIALTDVGASLPAADMIVTSTAAPHAIISRAGLSNALKQRRRKPIFILDLAVPRDVEPDAGKLEDIYLYTVDDLENVIQENRQSRQSAALLADTMLDERIDEYIDWLESRRAAGTITEIRNQGYDMRDRMLERARNDIARGRPVDEVLGRFGHALTNKLMHAPSTALRSARGAQQTALLDSARQLYRLDTDPDPDKEPKH